ncbi:hypothetical protein ABIA22_006100 [Sinorhizobium fredii]
MAGKWRSEDMLSSFRWGQDTEAPKQQRPENGC